MDAITLLWMDGQTKAQAFQVLDNARLRSDAVTYDPAERPGYIVVMKYPGHKHCGCDKSKTEIFYFIEHEESWGIFPIHHLKYEYLSRRLATHLQMDWAFSSYGFLKHLDIAVVDRPDTTT